MLKSNFLKYSVKDFLLDESFQHWVIQGHTLSGAGWLNWLKEHPEKHSKIAEAKATMQQLKSGLAEEVSHEDLKEVWIKINDTVNGTDLESRFNVDDLIH
jgi:hypothetical protein